MRVAVLVAIETHADGRIEPVAFAAADMAALAAVLEQHGFAAADRVLLVNEQATKTSIESRVRRVCKAIHKDDVLLLAFTGRTFIADGQRYIACHDTAADDLLDTSIELKRLLRQLSDSACEQTILFLDLHADAIAAFASGEIDGDEEWQAVLESDVKCSCFVSNHRGESSHSSNAFQHGIWAYHLSLALDGQAPSALVNEQYLTPRSLQNHLETELPRTLAKTFTTKKTQTPWLTGARSRDAQLFDLADLFASRQADALPDRRQIKNVSLVSQKSQGVRSLSGFMKGFKEPDRVSSSSAAFIAKISGDEITSDVNSVFAELKKAFKLKRADSKIANEGDGTATINTPFFDYSISVALDPADTSQVVFRRSVDAIKQPERIFSDAFALVFENVFDTVEVDTPAKVDLTALIDRIEELEEERIRVQYDPEVTYCTLQIEGVAGAITVTSHTFSIVHSRPAGPKTLLQSLFAIQQVLVDEHNIRLIPFV